MSGMKHKLLLPTRVITCIMGFLCIVLAYMLRQALNYAITQIAPKPTHSSGSDDVCPYHDEWLKSYSESYHEYGTNDTIRFDWSQEMQGVILSSFYWGYILTHIPGALLAQQIGGRDTAIIGMAICAIFTLLTPIATEHGAEYGLIPARILVGAGEGLLFTSCSTLIAVWMPFKERTIAVSAVFSGVEVGAFIGSLWSGLLIHDYGWKSPFYVFGTIAVIWILAAFVLCSNNPDSHLFINVGEKNYLMREIGELKRRTDLPATPWRAILTSAAVWAIVLAQMGHTWGLFVILTDLPKYVNDVLHYPIKQNGLYTSLPWVFMWVVTIGTGILGDYLIKHKYLGRTFSRKLYTAIAAFGPAIFIVAASYFGCDVPPVIAMFCLGMGFMGTYFPGIKTNCVDLAPNYAGIIMAITNGAGGIMGIAVPIVVGWLTPESMMTQWRLVFWITFGVLNGTTAVYLIFGTAKVQSWNDTSAIAETNDDGEAKNVTEVEAESDDDDEDEKKVEK